MASTDLAFTESASTVSRYELVPDELVSDEADDLVAALLARDRLDASRGEAISLEDAMRAHGFDPAQFGLE